MYIILFIGKKVAIFLLSSEKQFSIPYCPVNRTVSQKEKNETKMTGVLPQTEERRTQPPHVNENA